MLRKNIVIVCLLFLNLYVSAQVALVRCKNYNYPVESVNSHIYRMAISLNNGEVMMWQFPLTSANAESNIIKFNPSGAYVAVGTFHGKIKLWGSKTQNDIYKTLRGHNSTITNMVFDKTGNQLISGDEAGEIILWDIKQGEKLTQTSLHHNAISGLNISKNGMVASADKSGHVLFWDKDKFINSFSRNNETYAVDIVFSDDGKWLAISYNDGLIQLLDYDTFDILKEIWGEKVTNPIAILPNSMYLAYTRCDSLLIYNCKKFKNVTSVKAHDGIINDLCIIYDDFKKQTFLISGGEDSKICIWDLNQLEKRYDIIIKAFVDSNIEAWQRIKENENPSEYINRVTDMTRFTKIQELTQEITNNLAIEKYPLVITNISKYDYDNQTFEMELDSLIKIIISVPHQQSKYVNSSVESLRCRNPRFVLNNQNDFELAYVEVFDHNNANTYTYNRNNEYRFDPKSINIEYVPIKIASQIALTEEILKEKLETMTNQSFLENKITDNVQTNVNAKAVIEENESGVKELNFHVEYSYEVIKASIQSETDDFPLGEFKFSSSNAARLTLQVFKESLENELADYLKSQKKVSIKIKGSTDGTPIMGKIPYSNDYGAFINEPYFLNGNLESISITQTTGITKNEQLAFLRTIGVQRFIEDYIDILKNTKNSYQHFAEVSEEKGGQYRRISIELIIHNAFEGMDQLPERLIHKDCESDVDVEVPINDTIRTNSFALVIGNENYSSFNPGLSKEVDVNYAVNDAERIAEYFNKTLGIPERQIKILKNATTSQMKQGISWLINLAKIEGGKANLFFYYSGHGLPDENTRESYIIPVDVNGIELNNAIKLDDIYAQFSTYPTERITVFLDACFSGGARERSLVEKKRVKVVPKKETINNNMIVITSSQGNESSGYLKEECHGLFTYFLLKKLKETKCKVSYSDLFRFVNTKVIKESSLQGDVQTPELRTGWNIDKEWVEWGL